MHEGLPPAPVFVVAPFVDELVDDEYAFLVGYARERGAVGIVATAEAVEAKLLHHAELATDGIVVGGGPQCSEVVVIGNAFEEDFLAVEFEAKVGRVFDTAHPEALRLVVNEQAIDIKVYIYII